MSKKISLSEEVYERLQREKGDRSVSELIADLLDARCTLADVSGVGVLDCETHEDVKRDVTTLSHGTVDRFEDGSPR